MTTRAESTQYFSALQGLGRGPKSGESDHHRCEFGVINLPRSPCRARREPRDRLSPIVHLVVESRRMAAAMLTLSCLSGQVRPTAPCRMQMYRGSIEALIDKAPATSTCSPLLPGPTHASWHKPTRSYDQSSTLSPTVIAYICI
jgi:hypothetical protein